jgi:hypothetical protein
MEAVPGVFSIIGIGGVFATIAMLFATTYDGAIAVHLGRPRAIRLAVVGSGLLAAWAAVTAIVADAGGYRTEAVLGITILAVFAAVLLSTRVPAVRALGDDPRTLPRLVGVQFFRVIGVLFVIMMFLGGLPAVFALPAGLGDLAVGISAPFVARRLAKGDTRGARLFNWLGITDLVVAVTIGVLAGTVQLIHVQPTTELMTVLPFVIVPTLAVPLYVALHVISLRLLAKRA